MIDSFSGKHRFLSNFFPSPIPMGMHDVAPTAEHAFQAMKTSKMREQKLVLSTETPGRAKRAGRRVTLRSDWEEVKLSVMLAVVRAKFAFEHNPELVVKLINTGDQELVEGNHWNDTFWGVCNGLGENHLGKILMQVRTEMMEKHNGK